MKELSNFWPGGLKSDSVHEKGWVDRTKRTEGHSWLSALVISVLGVKNNYSPIAMHTLVKPLSERNVEMAQTTAIEQAQWTPVKDL